MINWDKLQEPNKLDKPKQINQTNLSNDTIGNLVLGIWDLTEQSEVYVCKAS